MNAQRTLRRAVSCAGIGLHSGRKVTLSLKPAPADFGIRFRRSDLGGLEVPATVKHVGGINYATGRVGLTSWTTGNANTLRRAGCITTLGDAISAGQLTDKLSDWNSFARSLGCFHQRFDLFLTPTLAHPPVVHGSGDPPAGQRAALGFLQRTGLLGAMARLGLLDSTTDQIARDSLRYVPFTQLANLTGTPAMSLPLHWTPEGLPVGVQIAGSTFWVMAQRK